MKKTLILVLLFNQYFAYAQTKKKPSWGEDIPERKAIPKININSHKNFNKKVAKDRNIFDDDTELTNRIQQRKRQSEKQREQELEIQRLEEIERQRLEEIEKQKLEEQKRQEIENQRLARIVIQKRQEERQKQEQEQLEREQTAQNTNDFNESPNIELENTDNQNTYSWKILKQVAPKYPPLAVRKKIEGWVLVEIEINKNGDVVDAIVINTYKNRAIFKRNAVNAVKKWKFVPPQESGIFENLKKKVKIAFNL